jgi:hypothetical protein
VHLSGGTLLRLRDEVEKAGVLGRGPVPPIVWPASSAPAQDAMEDGSDELVADTGAAAAAGRALLLGSRRGTPDACGEGRGTCRRSLTCARHAPSCSTTRTGRLSACTDLYCGARTLLRA